MSSDDEMPTTLNLKTNQFPHFEDGEVTILLSASRTYQLHARTLRMHSPYFARLLISERAAKLSPRAKKEGIKTLYRIELKPPAEDQEGVGQLHLRVRYSSPRLFHNFYFFVLSMLTLPQILDDRARARGPSTIDPDIENGRLPSPIYKHYDNLFRAYYSQPLHLDDSTLPKLLSDIVGLSDVADAVQSLKVVALPLENALIKQGQILWRSISANATIWAGMALRLHSEVIMKEAVIHMAGQWNKAKERDDIDDSVRALCEKKWKELRERKIDAEKLIMGHYPSHLTRPTQPNVGLGGQTILFQGVTRVDVYSTQIIAWMAMNLYRHWVGQHICADSTRYAEDEGYAFYNAVAAGGDKYLDNAAVEGFAQFFPMSRKARGSLDEQLGLLKEGVKGYVKELVKNRSMLDTKSFNIAHLTCTIVEKEDMPWAVGEEKRRTAGSTRSKRGAEEDEDDEEEEENEDGDVPAAKRQKTTGRALVPYTPGNAAGPLPWEESSGEEGDDGDVEEV